MCIFKCDGSPKLKLQLWLWRATTVKFLINLIRPIEMQKSLKTLKIMQNSAGLILKNQLISLWLFLKCRNTIQLEVKITRAKREIVHQRAT